MLPEGAWQDVLSGTCCQGGSQQLAEVIGEEPVVVLARVERCTGGSAGSAPEAPARQAQESDTIPVGIPAVQAGGGS